MKALNISSDTRGMFAMLGFIRCLFLTHSPRRRRVKKLISGMYIGYCEHCDAPIRRLKRDIWVRDWKRTFGRSYDSSEIMQD